MGPGEIFLDSHVNYRYVLTIKEMVQDFVCILCINPRSTQVKEDSARHVLDN